MNCFDYENQRWLSGAAAATLRIEHLEAELAILQGSNAEDYARFIGLQPADIAPAVARVQAELSTLRGTK